MSSDRRRRPGRALLTVGSVLLLLAVGLTGCSEGASVPEGWQQDRDAALVFAVPGDFERSEAPDDPAERVQWLRGDPSEPAELEYVVTRRTGVREGSQGSIDTDYFLDVVYGVGGWVEELEDSEIEDHGTVEVPGAMEARRFRHTYTEPELEATMVTESLVVRAEEHLYEIRYQTKAQNEDEGLMDRLAQTVEVDP